MFSFSTLWDCLIVFRLKLTHEFSSVGFVEKRGFPIPDPEKRLFEAPVQCTI